MYTFPRATLTKVPQTGRFKTEFMISLLWRPEVQNQGVDRAVLPLKALGEDLFQASLLAFFFFFFFFLFIYGCVGSSFLCEGFL